MSTRDILKALFTKEFPSLAPDLVDWRQNKDGTINVELTGKRFYVFTYVDEHTWRLETVRMYKKGK